MGAEGGFEAVVVLDESLANIVLRGLRVGKLGVDTGFIVDLFGKRVYLGCYGSNYYGIALNEIKYLDPPEDGKEPLTVESLKALFEYVDWMDNLESEDPDRPWSPSQMISYFKRNGITTTGQLVSSLKKCCDWDTLVSFETWT